MTARHLLVAGALGAALLAVPAVAAERPTAAGALAAAQAGAAPGEAYAQYRRYGGGGYYGRGYRRGPSGGAVAAGVIGGLAAGALIGGLAAQAAPAPVYGAPAYGYGPGAPVGNVYGRDPELVDYCARRYRSYDPASGTFLASDGFRYPCS